MYVPLALRDADNGEVSRGGRGAAAQAVDESRVRPEPASRHVSDDEPSASKRGGRRPYSREARANPGSGVVPVGQGNHRRVCRKK